MFYFSSKTLKLVEALSGEFKDSFFALCFVCSECVLYLHLSQGPDWNFRLF